ncbi:MAG: 4-(cytidine 5'-diphospho)-2-C-methyl-D-erythritol kinase [Bacteroides sp.]|nr:4-(cytidine 5'-diphospho)-2-C-methyl-D-erythritol kinase [Bacteroides sp.]MDD2645339.1 4-(cytidine 5'-diphospho)-2-C-methyl-D-erythritol kinase [Bacteroides sp.]MDD4055561.1 4-(cytidine 5'-diphospho)-2-C-methyl-D-erythritol kinase [Bacteroides sp.]MDD4720354.1 4-(cytidine 5'-diphospho)-2-C-methyl-D-erythritol kinase [Bacteroides sp.]
MITFSNAKINIGLSIVSKRTDGYHNLETVFYPIPITDVLEIYNSKNKDKSISLHVFGNNIPGEFSENLIVKAYNLLSKDFNLTPIDVFLSKKIPSGSGLGGGSSNAACMIKSLNSFFNLNLSAKRMEEYATQLGADCPFFIQNKPVFAEGIGELFTPINLSLKGHTLLVIKPKLFISTQEAFSRIQPKKPLYPLLDCIQLPINRWEKYITNDFEKHLFVTYPELQSIKDFLYNSGALYAAMSGSGPSIYGIFNTEDSLPDLSRFTEYYLCNL